MQENLIGADESIKIKIWIHNSVEIIMFYKY